MGSRLASPFSFSHVDVGDAFHFINHTMAERRREETKYEIDVQIINHIINDISQRKTNRSEWCSGKALECQYNFKPEIGVKIINHIIAEIRKKKRVGVV